MRMRPKFCPDCGSALTEIVFDNKTRLYCEKCAKPIYENPLPATCVVAFNKSGKVLIAKRAVEPSIGEWSLPGGFVEIDETPSEGALRELLEETGLRGNIISHLGTEGQKSNTYTNVMVAGFLVTTDGIPSANDDIADAKWFNIDSAPRLVFSSHRRIFNRAIESLSRTLLPNVSREL
ncbi:NUDIX hydrolase [bacterium]|nr:NUDIX hydrolase [bacterium]